MVAVLRWYCPGHWLVYAVKILIGTALGDGFVVFGDFEPRSGNFDGGAKFEVEGWPRPRRLDVTACPHRPAAKCLIQALGSKSTLGTTQSRHAKIP